MVNEYDGPNLRVCRDCERSRDCDEHPMCPYCRGSNKAPFYPMRPSPGGDENSGLLAAMLASGEWVVEAKYDGERCVMSVWSDGVDCWTRHGKAMEVDAYTLARVFEMHLEGEELDGEMLRDGRYVLFDYHDNAAPYPYSQRRRELHRETYEGGRVIEPAVVPDGMTGPEAMRWALELGDEVEGLVAKRLSSIYKTATDPKARPSQDWVKFLPTVALVNELEG